MTVPPDELSTYRGSELCLYLDTFFADRDGEIRGSERVRSEKLFREPSDEQLNRADVFFAMRRMIERMATIGGGDRTVQELITTFRSALKEAAFMRTSNGQSAKAADEPKGLVGEDHDPGERRAFGH